MYAFAAVAHTKAPRSAAEHPPISSQTPLGQITPQIQQTMESPAPPTKRIRKFYDLSVVFFHSPVARPR